MKGKGVYKGKHWTQQPENRERLMAMNRKASKAKAKQFRTIARVAKQAVRGQYKKRTLTRDATSVVINGWRITLGSDEIRIDHE